MLISIAALGTRGDVQPMIALGLGLQRAGHRVRLIAGANFGAWIESHGLELLPSVDIEALMRSSEGVAWAQGSDKPMAQLRQMRRLLRLHGAAMAEPLVAAGADSDLLLAGFVSEPYIQAVSEKFDRPYICTLLQPYRATRSGAASLSAPLARRSSVFNLLAGRLAERLIWDTASESVNGLRARLGLAPQDGGRFRRLTRDVPTVLGISPQVVSPAADWPAQTFVSGYWFLDDAVSPPPAENLAAFLNAGPPPVYVGFGSMTSRDPERTLALILDASARSGVRVVIGAGWSGASAAALPAHALLVDHVPHGWLFSQVAAVVHHGGAGTTAAALRAGRPSLIVPHMADQPYWGRRVAELGVGLHPIARHQLTPAALADALHRLTTDDGLRQRAAAIGERIRAERGVDAAIAFIETHAG